DRPLCAAALGERAYRAGPCRAAKVTDEIHKIAPQPWMTAPQTRAIIEALGKAGIEARFVGGCVRDALLGRPIADIDLATPAQRIAEDVLRVLRYYRFEARFGAGTGDSEARAACRAAVPLLPKLSAERVSQELLRLMAVPDPLPALRMMEEDGVLAAIVPEASRFDRLQQLVGMEPKPVQLRRLGELCGGAGAGAGADDQVL